MLERVRVCYFSFERRSLIAATTRSLFGPSIAALSDTRPAWAISRRLRARQSVNTPKPNPAAPITNPAAPSAHPIQSGCSNTLPPQRHNLARRRLSAELGPVAHKLPPLVE